MESKKGIRSSIVALEVGGTELPTRALRIPAVSQFYHAFVT